MVPKIVLTRSGPISLNTARLVNIVKLRTAVNNARPMKNVINNAYSTARRPFNKITADNNSNFNKRVNIVNDKNINAAWPNAVVNIARPKAVLSKVRKTRKCCIENLIDLRVKVIRCDNRTEFKNRVMNQFCEMKGIKREFSVARTPQQNGAEAVNTACYVQNRVLVIKPHNKTPYELFLGRKPALSFMRPFGCPVTILNTIDHLGKFDGKADEGFFVGYSTNSKAFRVFNSRTRIVEENPHVQFSKNTPNIIGSGPNWIFDIDALTKSMNYKPIVIGNQSNDSTDTKACDNADPPFSSSSKDSPNTRFKPLGEEEKKDAEDPRNEDKDDDVNENIVYGCDDDPDMLELEEIVYSDNNEDVGAEANINNLDIHIPVSPIPTTRIHKDHPLEQIIGDIYSAPQIRRMIKSVTEQAMFSSMDVKSAFLYGKIEEEVYVCQPPGFEDPDFPDRVYKVEKALYGLHQAPKAWYETYVNLLVDKGLQVKQKEDGSEDKYVTEILKKFGFSDVKTTSTPMETHKPLIKDADGDDVDEHLYRSMIGSLMYLTYSRPNIMFTATAKAKTVNGEVQLQALVDGKKVIITETSLRRVLKLKDAEGIECLPSADFFEQLALIGYEKPSQKLTFYKALFSP
ncbi:putative ribonuclease H-like domain-containing protein [Tanacetum coccineum]